MKQITNLVPILIFQLIGLEGCSSLTSATECVHDHDCPGEDQICRYGECVPSEKEPQRKTDDVEGTETDTPSDTEETSVDDTTETSDDDTENEQPVIPEAPLIDGEPSCGHTDPTWTWNHPNGTAYMEYRINDAKWIPAGDARSHTDEFPPDTTIVFGVRACNASNQCSRSDFTTVIEPTSTYPEQQPTIWDDISKDDLAISPENRVVAIACHNCYVYSDISDSSESSTTQVVNNAVGQNADLIGLDIITENESLFISREDPLSPAERPPFDIVLSNQTFTDSDALLFIELKEDDTSNTSEDDPETLAPLLLQTLDAHREAMRNGRPVFFRAFADFMTRMPYLEAIDEALDDYPMIARYAKFSAILSLPLEEVEMIRKLKASFGFLDMIEIQYGTEQLQRAIDTAREEGLSVALWGIPKADWDPEIIQQADLLIVNLALDSDKVSPLKTVLSTPGDI